MTPTPKAKHTPGPWVLLDKSKAPYQPTICNKGVLTGENPKYICDLRGPSDVYCRPNSETEANAYLIAAAPELLEALKGLYEGQLDYIRVNNLHGSENNHWMVAAKTAITKATGGKDE